jgi:hypothetical protein
MVFDMRYGVAKLKTGMVTRTFCGARAEDAGQATSWIECSLC